MKGTEFLPKESGEHILQKDAVVLLPRIGSATSYYHKDLLQRPTCLQRAIVF